MRGRKREFSKIVLGSVMLLYFAGTIYGAVIVYGRTALCSVNCWLTSEHRQRWQSASTPGKREPRTSSKYRRRERTGRFLPLP